MKFLWISGWAVPPTWFMEQAQMAFPEAIHTAVSPKEAGVVLQRDKPDVLGGYSLGALWLLMQAKANPATMPVILLAPLFSFAAENREGGRIALTQLKLQRRRFRNDPKAAVADFYERSGLLNIVPALKDFTKEEIVALDAELGWLENWRAEPPPPAHWQGFVGDKDPLLDAEKLKEKWPRLQVVANTGHDPRPLLQAAAKEFLRKGQR